MSRYTDAVCRKCRTHGVKLLLKGERCYTNKCALEKRRSRPGQHGLARQKVSEYGIRLKEKQKLRTIYGVSEKQFRRYYDIASNAKGVTGENLLQLLETRLDNVIYRLGFASSRIQARMWITHGHIVIGGKKVSIPSYRVKSSEKIAIKQSSQEFIKEALAESTRAVIPNWLSVDADKLEGQVLTIPVREEIDTCAFVQDNLVVEFYSK